MRNFRSDYFRPRYSGSTFLAGFATGLFAGALGMFIFDPEQGRRRRALARDKMVRYRNEIGEYVSGAAQDLGNRAYGVAKEAEGLVRSKTGTSSGEQAPLATTGGSRPL
jgi:hypothetical protein